MTQLSNIHTIEKAKTKKIGDFNPFNRVSAADKIFFFQNLAIMIKTGISLSTSIKTLSEQTDNKYFKKVLNELYENVDRGESFSKSASQHPKIFPEIYVNMIEAGEVSGKLESVLVQLTLQLKKQHQLRSKIRGAMTYPAIIVFAMLSVGTFAMVYVIPKMTAVFADLGSDLPLATRILIGTSDFMINNYIGIIILVIFLIIFVWQFRKNPQGKLLWHKFLLHLPIVGKIIKKIQIASFARTLSSLLKTEIAVIDSLKITSKNLTNSAYAQALSTTSQAIETGSTISSNLSKYPSLFPPIITQMISVGEQTGSLDTILEELAEFYEEDVDQIMSNLPSIIEPVLILALGVAVGGMALAIIMPMYSLVSKF